MAAGLVRQARAELTALPGDSTPLEALADYVVSRKK
jgi:hypothetical protein